MMCFNMTCLMSTFNEECLHVCPLSVFIVCGVASLSFRSLVHHTAYMHDNVKICWQEWRRKTRVCSKKTPLILFFPLKKLIPPSLLPPPLHSLEDLAVIWIGWHHSCCPSAWESAGCPPQPRPTSRSGHGLHASSSTLRQVSCSCIVVLTHSSISSSCSSHGQLSILSATSV